MRIKIKKLNLEARIPSYALKGDAGMDLFSCEDAVLKPGERKAVSTGIAIEFPEGYAGLIWDKGGMAVNSGIKTMGGVFEHTYRGDYKIILLNTSDEEYHVKKGDKIAQLLIQPVVSAEIEQVQELSESPRGERRFGSTGKN